MHAVLAALVLCWTPTGEVQTEHFVFRYSPAVRHDVQALASRVEPLRLRIVSDLGVAPPVPTLVVVAATPQEFVRAQPGGRRLPGWAAGVAYPRQNLIILGPPPPGGSRFGREVLLAHEFSHVALAHSVDFRPLPRWFSEGVADMHAMAPLLGDHRGAFRRGALPLHLLHRELGEDHHRAAQSYRQSYDFVLFLRGQGAPGAFRRFIRLLRDGMGFDQALQTVYGVTTGKLESRWRREWNWRNVIVPMVTSGLILWVLAAALLVLGFVRKRRERLAQIAAMDGDDPEEVAMPGDRAVWPDDGPGEPAEPEAEEAPFLTPGLLLTGAIIAVVVTALLALVWPHTRWWLLAGPAALVAVLALRWASRK